MKHGYWKEEKHGHKKVNKQTLEDWGEDCSFGMVLYIYIFIDACTSPEFIYIYQKKIDIYMQANRELSYQIEI